MRMISCFAPVINKDTHTIILGTMPGPESLLKMQYYANDANLFWDIVFRSLPTIIEWDELISDLNISYEKKKARLLSNGIGLWDVIKVCKRDGGAGDIYITDDALNDFDEFFKLNPQIEFIMFNGTTAHNKFKRNFKNLYKRIDNQLMQSTSSQNTTNAFYTFRQWKYLLIERASFKSV